MKIALVIEHFDPRRGGRELSIAQVASALARRGHDVTVLCQSCSDAGEGIRAVALKARGLTRAARLGSFVRSVHGAAAEEGYDILHATLPIPGCHVYQPRGGLAGAQAAAAMRRRPAWQRPAAVAAHQLNACRRKARQLERKVVGDPSVLCLAVSEMVAREFLHYYARTEGVRVIYNAVEVPQVSDEQRRQWRDERRDQVGAGPGSPLFLVIARNFALKGVHETLQAFARWHHSPQVAPGSRLVILGTEAARRGRLLARRLGVAREVCFVEPTLDVFPWYSAADVCVLLSWYDPCSRVVLEAARWGVPSITTVYNGAAEVLGKGAGIVVSSPRDREAVVRAMAELADPARRRPRIEACLALSDELSMDRHVTQLLAAYEEVLRRP